MESNNIINIFPFVSHANDKNKIEYKTKNDVLVRIDAIFSSGFHGQFYNVSRSGIEKCMGFAYDYRPFLKRILVKQYGQWSEYYAPNKTKLRRCLCGTISEMVYI